MFYKKSKLLLKIIVFCIFVSNSLFAFYEEKSGYPYYNNIVDIYVGFKVGSSMNTTLEDGEIDSLFMAQRMLSTGYTGISLGATFYDFRVETEYSYYYHWTDLILDSTLYSTDVNIATFPDKGQEVLKNLWSLNFYYDMKLFSELFYPYVGFGIGNGIGKTIFRDLVLQPNGFGEQYHGESEVRVSTFMFGFEYATKVLKSAVSLEYRLTRASSYTVSALNYDTTQSAIYLPGDDGYTFPADWDTTPNDMTISSIFHSIIFTFKYYLY